MLLDISKLEVSVAEGEHWRRTLSITVPSMLMKEERKAALAHLASRLKLPGFRAGKVPVTVLEQRFGPTLEQEVLDRIIGEAYRGVLEHRSLRPISEGEVGEIDYQPESDLKFEISFDVAPQIELARVGGFKVKRPAGSVSETQVEQVLSRIREESGTWTPEEGGTPEEGDLVSIRIHTLGEEESEPRPYELVLGRDQAIPDIETSIRTLEVGASGEFAICFPDDLVDEDRRGTEQRVRITLDSRKRLELPELNDELARTVGDFETADELVERVREDLAKEAERESDAALQAALIEQVLSANPFDIPESMIDQYVRAALGDQDDLPEERFHEAKEQLRPRALHTVKRHLVIDRVAEAEGLVASTEEVDSRIEEIAERSGATLSVVYTGLRKSGRLDHLEREITEQKVFEFLRSQSEVTEQA
jgi:trigger factor